MRTPAHALAATACFAALAQDATYSTPGPPEDAPQQLPPGVGYSQTPQIVSQQMLMSSAAQPAQVHYHLPGGDSTGFSPYAGTPGVAPTPPPNWQWHYFNADNPPPGAPPMMDPMPGNNGADRYHVNYYGGSFSNPDYIPSPDNPIYGSGAFVGNWDPYALGGAGYIQGFD